MALLDRFRSLPVARHPDPDVRLAHVEGLSIDEREQLASFAREDESPRVRRAAVGKLMDPSVLATVSREDADAAVRMQAASMLRDIALEAFEETSEQDSLAAVGALSDSKTLAQIAKTATRESVAALALERVDDARTRGSIARHAALEPVRAAACASLTDREELLAVALNSAFKDSAVAAVDRLPDRADLEHIVERSKNKGAVKRARAVLRELNEQFAQASEPYTPVVEVTMESAAVVDQISGAEPVPAALDEPPREVAETTGAGAGADVAAEVQGASEDGGQLTMGQTAIDAEAAEQARKETERRRERLVELVAELEAAAADEDLRSAGRRHSLVRREWRDLTSAVVADETLLQRYAAADARLAARDQEAKEADRRARQEALARMRQVVDAVEAVVAKEDATSKATERALREVRSTMSHVPPLPSRQEYEEVVRRLKAAQAALTPKLQSLREVEAWQRWANVGIQEQLCEKMEALKTEENAEEVAHRIRDLQQQWRQAADVPREQSDALWQRFKKAHDEVWARCEAHFAAEAVTRAENLKKKIALCEQVEALADSTRWIQTADSIKALQAEWKTIGPVSRGQEKAIWERFRAACDRFFTRRHEDLAQRKVSWAENYAKKEALCVKVEALADSTDWDAAAAEIKRLQGEWKTIGAVKKSRSEMIWQRFRGACDRFFARYAQRHEIARGERVAAREALCAELEAIAQPQTESPEAPAELLVRIRSIRSRWQQELAARGVEPARAAQLDQRFSAAFEQVRVARPEAFAGTDLDPEANRRRMEALVERMEKLASALRGSSAAHDAALTPTTRLAAMLKEALASNTIGGKVDEGSRVRAAQEDVRQAQASWLRIGPVPEPQARPLTDRFQRACRAVADLAPPFAGGTASGGGGTRGDAGGPGRPGRPGGPARG